MSGKKSRIGIFGGSFDPIHNGHIGMARQLLSLEGLDRILFMPNYINPFKLDNPPASSSDRLAMLRLALQEEPGLEVSDYELCKGHSSYTIDTLEELSRLHPEWEIVFIAGADSAEQILTWHRGSELVRNFRIICGTRGRDRAAEGVHFYDTEFTDISSTTIRQLVREGKSVKGLLPDKAEQYILLHGLYAADGSGLEDRLLEYIKGNLKPSRLAHTMGVVNTAENLAVRYGADPQKARIAALFHDAYRHAGNLTHGPIAADHLEKDFGVTDEEILNAVRWHTTGRRGMSLLEKVIKLADMIEPGRNYPGVQQLRDGITDDPDASLLAVMKHTRDYVTGQGMAFDDASNEAIAYLEGIMERKDKWIQKSF